MKPEQAACPWFRMLSCSFVGGHVLRMLILHSSGACCCKAGLGLLTLCRVGALVQNTLVGVAYTDVNVNDGASRRNVLLRENGELQTRCYFPLLSA